MINFKESSSGIIYSIVFLRRERGSGLHEIIKQYFFKKKVQIIVKQILFSLLKI
jgi:hypothetical protein